MTRMLFVASRGSDDPTMATFPFELAIGAVKEGHEAAVALLGEAVTLMKDPVAEELHGFGCLPFREVLAETIEHGIPVYV
jgi:predicted peroxiredoxin